MSSAFILCLLLMVPDLSFSQEPLQFKGQLSSYAGYNNSASGNYTTGIRYIPQFNFSISSDENLYDAEFSLNAYHNSLLKPSTNSVHYSKIKPYRLWVRYSGEQFEIRGGLQKINFGSASVLRPLMWFDKLDPRDPLQLTDGVYALLARYYFLDNSNIWLWGLYGNNDLKTWEFSKTAKNTPEFGGRIQSPLLNGEAAITYHFRKTDMTTAPVLVSGTAKSAEHRIGIDGKWDYEAGMWIESCFIFRDPDAGILKNQELITAGLDYTFALGNGLNVAAEQLLSTSGEKPAQFTNKTDLSALYFSYPVSVSDRITFISYYDWKRKNLYNFINWQLLLDNTSLSVIAFSNPAAAPLPQQSGNGTLFTGAGFQLLYIYNH